MSKIDSNNDSQLVVIPLKEYKYLKSVVNRIGRKIKNENDSDFLTPSQLKRINEIEENIKKDNWSDFVDFDEFRKKFVKTSSGFVRNKNRKKSKQIHR